MNGENNILIAEFMGGKSGMPFFTCDTWDIPNMPGYIHVLYYDTSWDWLMPVLERIEEGPYAVQVYKNMCYISEDEKSIGFKIITGEGNTKIEAAYKAVIKFIKWRNEENE